MYQANLNEAFILLIPKKKKSNKMKDFVLIFLCNVVHKIIANVIVNMLIFILPQVVSE